MNLKMFYKDNYTLRLLDSNHLMKEIQHCLEKKLKQGNISKEFSSNFICKAETNLSMLNFEKQVVP